MNNDLWAAYNSIIGNEEEEKETEEQVQRRQVPVSANAFKIVEMEVSDSSDEDLEALQQQYKEVDPDSNKPIRSTHEIPIQEFNPGEIPATIPDSWKLIPACKIVNKVANLCMADTIERVIEPGSLLVLENRTPTTRVVELFGQIENPKLIINGDYAVGQILYTVAEDSKVPDPDLIAHKYKGTDASNRYDEAVEEPSSDDDEEEDAPSSDNDVY